MLKKGICLNLENALPVYIYKSSSQGAVQWNRDEFLGNVIENSTRKAA